MIRKETALSVVLGCMLAVAPLNLSRAQNRSDSTAVADSLLILELQREMTRSGSEVRGETEVSPPRSRAATNPDISVISDFRASYLTEGDRNVDAEFHEAEMSLRSAVDPYVRGGVFIAIANEDGEFAFELEEAYITTLTLPHRLQLKAGKFRSGFGKINRIHPHALPYIDVPTIYVNYFGEEGLNDQGISVNWLLPNRRFLQDLTIEVTRGPGESQSFVVHEGNRLLYVGHQRNFWELSDDATFELGLSGAVGPNEDGETTVLGGIDVTYKWKPIQFNTYRSLTLQSEAIVGRKKDDDGSAVSTFGIYALANYQLARRWFAVGRYDHSDVPDFATWNENAVSLTLGWYATEFQKLEFGIKSVSMPGEDRLNGLSIRSITVIGTHGAHEY